jgi:hypothetical protein
MRLNSLLTYGCLGMWMFLPMPEKRKIDSQTYTFQCGGCDEVRLKRPPTTINTPGTLIDLKGDLPIRYKGRDIEPYVWRSIQ